MKIFALVAPTPGQGLWFVRSRVMVYYYIHYYIHHGVKGFDNELHELYNGSRVYIMGFMNYIMGKGFI